MKISLVALSVSMALSPATGISQVTEKQKVEKVAQEVEESSICTKYPWLCAYSTDGNGGGTEPPIKKDKGR